LLRGGQDHESGGQAVGEAVGVAGQAVGVLHRRPKGGYLRIIGDVTGRMAGGRAAMRA